MVVIVAIFVCIFLWLVWTNFQQCPLGKICLDKKDYDEISKKQSASIFHVNAPLMDNKNDMSIVRERDMRVLHDPLYPSLNRTESSIYKDVAMATRRREINVPTRYNTDTYRLVGYLVNDEDNTSKQWKLFGRMKDRNRGDFYMIPADKTIDLKVQITENIMTGTEKLRSLDDIPTNISFKTPILNDKPYTFIELPKGDFSDEYS